jgi:ribosomal protein L37AE/L43A
METTRKAALAKGDKYYDTGKPCKHGHRSKKATNNWTCNECNKKRAKSPWHTFSEAQKEQRREKDTPRLRKWRLENAEHCRECIGRINTLFSLFQQVKKDSRSRPALGASEI